MAVQDDWEDDDFELSEQDLLPMEVLQGAEEIYVTDAIEAILDLRMNENAQSNSAARDDSIEDL